MTVAGYAVVGSIMIIGTVQGGSVDKKGEA